MAVDLVAFCAPSLTALILLWLLGPHTPTVLIGSAAALAAVVVLATQIIRYADVASPVQGGMIGRPSPSPRRPRCRPATTTHRAS